jgi:predicted GNAT family N-acyltransferase
LEQRYAILITRIPEELEMDDNTSAQHLVLYKDAEVIGTLRILESNAKSEDWRC